MRCLWLFFVSLVFAAVSGPTWADERVLTDAEAQQIGHAKTIYVDLTFSTWMKRGRTLSQIAPSVRIKLANAGLVVVPNATDAHDLTLRVNYREDKGREHRVDTFGTDITFSAKLEHEAVGPLLDITIKESPGSVDSGTPLYLEALEKFETNPYFYFLGPIVAGARSQLDMTGALIQSLHALVQSESVKGEQALSDYGVMQPGDTTYAAMARDNTIRELRRLKDPRSVPALVLLLQHRSPQVRLLSVEALRAMNGSSEALSALEQAATHDSDREVKQAAAAALDGSSSLRSVP